MGIVIELKSKPKKNWRIGSYSLVYLDYDRNRAIKIFRKKVCDPMPERLADPKFVYQDEVSAYQKIWGSDSSSKSQDVLRGIVPRYYGSCDIEEIKHSDVDANDFSLESNYCMELIPGNAEKLSKKRKVQSHREAFYEQGIYHIYDCSVFESNGNFMYIDFRVGNEDDKEERLFPII